MATTVRGLTVEIDADASKFNKQMSAVRKDAKSSQSELNALQKSLQLKFDGKKFEQAQKVAQSAIEATTERADLLRQRLKYLEEQKAVNTSHYRTIQNELAQAELEAQQLKDRLEDINKIKFDNISKNVKSVGDGLSKTASALTPISAGAAGVLTGLSAIGLKSASTAASIDDLTNRFGISAEKIQEWQYLALQTGVDVETFNKALMKARSSLVDLATGTENNATKALQSLGLSLKQFANSEDMFDGVIKALAGVENKTLQTAYANEIFGDKIATEMLPFLNAGTDELQKFKEEFASMSTLSTHQVKALAELDDTLNLLKESIKNVGLQIGASLQPLIKSIADTLQNTLIPKLQQVAEWFNSLSLSQQEFIAKALLIVAAIAPVIAIIGKLTSGIGGLIGMLPKLNSALSTLAANPIVLIISVVAALLVLLYTRCEAFRNAINGLVSTISGALAPILNLIMNLLTTIVNMISPILQLLGEILAVIINIVVDALSPFFNMLSLIFQLIQPLLQVALIPLQLALKALQVPLKILATLLQWLAPLFNMFAKVVTGAFKAVLAVINIILGAIEKAVNWVIDMINGLIDTYNNLLGWLFGNADTIGHVSLKVSTDGLDSGDIDFNPSNPDNIYDNIDTGGTSGDIYNNDYSTNNKTQNVTVVIQNYADEVDVDNLVRQINMKLAEEM